MLFSENISSNINIIQKKIEELKKNQKLKVKIKEKCISKFFYKIKKYLITKSP